MKHFFKADFFQVSTYIIKNETILKPKGSYFEVVNKN
jgi:hypothetical protein